MYKKYRMKKKTAGGQGSKSSNDKKEDTATVVEKILPTEREVQLKKQLNQLTEDLAYNRKQVEILQQENEFMQQEAQQVRVETHEYLAFMSKKTEKRHSAVITLSDRNAEQIQEINSKKEAMLIKFSKDKEELCKEIMSKEATLSSIKNELQQIQEFQVLQEQQQSEIMQLEKSVGDMRVKHNEGVQTLKAKFLEGKNMFESESEDKLNELSKEAKKEAYLCLHDHAIKTKHENRALRKELLELIQQSRAMHQHKLELEEQRKVLLTEQEYSKKISKLKKERSHKLYETFGVDMKASLEETKP